MRPITPLIQTGYSLRAYFDNRWPTPLAFLSVNNIQVTGGNNSQIKPLIAANHPVILADW
ncbi:hypothetical protein SAMN05192534_101367 [Alteribacillus persepolensis]|uniref:Uncharacterized protein n=1 Tax=Alteribacillus persepolensis TaxID=568899 RepID=A0A1G7Z234_9BACI|nr:hypothetical protein [Alteribacillus persepolensis]SDH02687.1 hypothetical protein SAMN05192534_101367 [Alteribacillus persepolensis]